MTEFLKSFSSMSLALALLPLRQVQTMLRPDQTAGSDENPGVRTMDAITSTAIRNFGGSLLKTFCTLDSAQRRAIALGARLLSSQERESSDYADWSWPTSGAEEHRADFGLRL